MLDAFEPAYMQRALAIGLLVAVPLGLLGAWVVLRGLAFFGHAVGVATFPGVVVGLGVPAVGPFVGALGAAAVFTGALGWVERDHRVRGGAVTALGLSVALAAGSVLLTTVLRTSAPVGSVLFGSLLGITGVDIARAAVVAVAVSALVALALPRLAAGTFDVEWARGAGGRPERGRVLLLAMVAVAVVCALPAVGSLLVSGLLVVPAATARLLTERLGPLLALSVGLCAAEIVGGLVLARELNVAPGAAIATLGGAAFALAALRPAGGR